jgi:cellobiose PTS system EIIC component
MMSNNSNKKVILDIVQEKLLPIGNFLANEKHFAAIQAGLMTTIGLTLIGAIFQIIASPPVTAEMMASGGILKTLFGGWYNFAQQYKDILMVPYNMSIGLFSVIVSFSIAYQLSKKYGMSALSGGIVSLTMFLMIAAPATTYVLADGSSITALSTTYMGGPGLFTAIIIALVSVEITRLCKKYNLVVKMPDSIPQFLQDSFTSLIPLLLNIVVLYGINVVIKSTTGVLLPDLITGLLMAPLSAVNSIPGMLFLIFIGTLLWICGVHGTMILYPLFLPILIEAITKNAALVAAGQDPVFSPVMIVGAIAMVGGTGNTLGFVILCLRSKSEQLKAIGKVGIIPSFFGVNEPVLFGAPIVYNPILAIPYILGSMILALIMWLGYSIGFLKPGYILIMSLFPLGVADFLSSMNINNFIFCWLMIPVMAIIWYPFFKIYEKQLVEKEALSKQQLVEEGETV